MARKRYIFLPLLISGDVINGTSILARFGIECGSVPKGATALRRPRSTANLSEIIYAMHCEMHEELA